DPLGQPARRRGRGPSRTPSTRWPVSDPMLAPVGRDAPALEITGLRVRFRSLDGKGPEVLAVDGIDLWVDRGRVLGLVGESGSGKSTVLLAIAGLLADSALIEGDVRLHGLSLLGLPERERARARGRGIGMVFQDPGGS